MLNFTENKKLLLVKMKLFTKRSFFIIKIVIIFGVNYIINYEQLHDP